jgi:hypothetical protein
MANTSEISGRTDAAPRRDAEIRTPAPPTPEYIWPLPKSVLFWITASVLGWAILLGALAYVF